jgi:ATP-binding cassette subfamily F protein 3
MMEKKTRKTLRGLRFTKSMIEGPYAALSGGWRARCDLVLALIVESDLLLLDEPSNYMVSLISGPG